MSAPKRRPAPEAPDLSTQSDFQILNAFTNLVSKEHSHELKMIAWEIMRRYASFLDKPLPPKAMDHNSILGDAKWGDAKRVEAIFGIKRSPLYALMDAGKIRSISLADDSNDARPSKRGKRLFDLASIAEYFDALPSRPKQT
jgi:hypothetical protein